MVLANLADLVKTAEKETKAVGAFNVPNFEAIRAVIYAAEKINSPVIIQHAQVHEKLVSIEEIGPVMLDFAKRASVPVGVHLDHGSTWEMCMKAIRLGFTSVMYDSSLKPYEINKKETKEIVKLAHSVGVSVEAELGQMMNAEVGSGEGFYTGDNQDPQKMFTDPKQAKEFADETGVDCLAVSFGTVHGLYTAEPKLDFERIYQIKQEANLPLVMHGGSGISIFDYQQAINRGVRKINYYTYMNQASGEKVKKKIYQNQEAPVFFDELSLVATAAMEENVLNALRVFNGNVQR